MSLIHCSSTLYYHRATVPLFYLTLLSLRHCSTVPPQFTITVPLFHHTLLSLRHCSTVLSHFIITAPLLHCSSTVYYCYSLPVRLPYIVIKRARIDAINGVCSELPCCQGAFLDLLSVHDNFGDEDGILRDILLPEKWKIFLNKHHTTSQDAKNVWCSTKSGSKHRKSSEVCSGNWPRDVCRTARILCGQ